MLGCFSTNVYVTLTLNYLPYVTEFFIFKLSILATTSLPIKHLYKSYSLNLSTYVNLDLHCTVISRQSET